MADRGQYENDHCTWPLTLDKPDGIYLSAHKYRLQKQFTSRQRELVASNRVHICTIVNDQLIKMGSESE
jgi:hypothetical protein